MLSLFYQSRHYDKAIKPDVRALKNAEDNISFSIWSHSYVRLYVYDTK